MATVTSILQSVGAKVDQDTALPSGTELTVRVNYVQQSQQDWADAYPWDILRKTHTVTVLLSMTSIGLPSNFERLLTPPYDASLTAGNRYNQINVSDRFNKIATDKYSIVHGDSAEGKYLTINPGLPSGASLVFDYLSTPSSLATTSDTTICPSDRFLIERTTYYVLEARSDQRFPIVEARSNSLLEQLIEDENTPTGGENNRVPDWQRSTGFRIGRD